MKKNKNQKTIADKFKVYILDEYKTVKNFKEFDTLERALQFERIALYCGIKSEFIYTNY